MNPQLTMVYWKGERFWLVKLLEHPDMLISMGGVLPDSHPSGACLTLGMGVPAVFLNAAEGYTKPGLRLFSCHIGTPLRLVSDKDEEYVPALSAE